MVNRPSSWRTWWSTKIVRPHWNNPLVRATDRLAWYAGWFPYLAGTDLIATMFSTVQRGSWLIRITAYDFQGRSVPLPLPFQSRRTFLQTYFFDHKEGKLFNNLYNDQNGCRHYAHYLCRQYNDPHQRIRDITFEIVSNPFYTREEAQTHGNHLQPQSPPWLIGDYACGN